MGYLEGALYLFFFIFLYRRETNLFAQWRAKKLAQHQARAGLEAKSRVYTYHI
jgi:hypothetical protein